MKRSLAGVLLAAWALAAPPASFASGADPRAALLLRYQQALQAAIMSNWIRPEREPAAPCRVHIEQLPGGRLLSVGVDADCPYDQAGRRSVVDAVRRAEPLPYRGYESVFRREVSVVFMPR